MILPRRLIRPVLLLLPLLALQACGTDAPTQPTDATPTTAHPDSVRVRTGAQVLLAERLPQLRGKRVALLGNHTSLVDSVHLVDTLRALGVEVVRVFAPEHGFRGEAEAGASVASGKDRRTGIPIVSLYGSQLAPPPHTLADVDLLLVDLQDVGCRFYTYISTMSFVMGACARKQVPVWVLDRPNPNGHYVAGPPRAPGMATFVGLHPVPVVHGLTLGEYARMANGEGWLPGGQRCALEVVPCKGYRHSMPWEATGLPWVPPSPNLPTPFSARLYPILCWYEGTVVSVGRGTDAPFSQIGMPQHLALRYRAEQEALADSALPLYIGALQAQAVRFVPRPVPGKAAQPMHQGQACYGLRFTHLPTATDSLWLAGLLLLDNFYKEHRQAVQLGKAHGDFFNPFFDKLAGGVALRQAIVAGLPAQRIWESWQPPLQDFLRLRARYLLYPD